MTTSELKKYIYENRKVDYVLEKIGCSNIKFHTKNKDYEYYTASHVDGDNPLGIVIQNNEWLRYMSYSRGTSFADNEDLLTVVGNSLKISLYETVKYLHSILGLEFTHTNKNKPKKEKKNELIEIFKKHKTHSGRKVNVDDLHFLDETILNNYAPLLHISWVREGIMPWTREKFGLEYSFERSRIIIPLRYWCTGELLGTNARTTIENYKELGIKKYFITPSYPKSINLFGLYENYKEIKKQGYVVVYEAEKSVLKRDSLGDATGVALQGHTLSAEQVKILLSLNVDIIFAMDKDIPIEEVYVMCDKVYKFRNTYFVYDFTNKLEEKDSPADACNEVYNFLLKNKIKYGDKHHKILLKMLEKGHS